MIKELLEKGNCSIILDTNVLLHIYQYSPDYSQFALDCLKTIKEHIVLPSLVHLEYSRHCHTEFKKSQRKVEGAVEGPTKQLKDVSAKMMAACSTLEQLHYPDIDELKEYLEEKFKDIATYLSDFFSERPGWALASSSFSETDILAGFVQELSDNKQVLDPFSQTELFRLCDEGKDRYKNNIPPGYKDNDKDGIRKYADLIIWKEILRFSKSKNRDVIFVTDDVKNDWWEKDQNGSKVFSTTLIDEFKKKTKQGVFPFDSRVFFDDISRDYSIGKPQMLELALHVNLSKLADDVADDVFSKIESSIIFPNSNYFEDSDIEVEGIDEFEIEEYEYLGVEENPDYIGEYDFSYNVIMSGISYDYLGRDDDTKEVIMSPGRIYTFEGIIHVEVSRDVDDYMDFDSFIITDASIKDGNLKQTATEDLSFNDGSDFEASAKGQVCLDCGRLLTWEDGSSGYCRDCAPNH